MLPLKRKFTLAYITAIAAVVSACGSSSSSSNSLLTSQAIDGYLVGSQVFCDDAPNGGTTASGMLSCPSFTSIARVRGGMDVGFDETANTDGIPFVGELSAPADLGYVTPSTTLAVNLSSGPDGFDRDSFAQSVNILGTTFGETDLDLSGNAAELVQLVRLNAKIHNIVSGFSSTNDEYVVVMDAFSQLIQNRYDVGGFLSLDTSVGLTVEDLNEILRVSAPELFQDTADLDNTIQTVLETNSLFNQATTPEAVAAIAVIASTEDALVTIDKSRSLVAFFDYFRGTIGETSVSEFENSRLINNSYSTTLDRNFDAFLINYDAFQINENILNANVTLGLSIASTDSSDPRSLTIVSPDVSLSAQAGQSNSIVIDVEEGGLLHLDGTSLSGVRTQTSVEFDDEDSFQSTNGAIYFNLRSAQNRLGELGFDDILDRSGNFEVTLVISGATINEITDLGEVSAEQFTIESGSQTVTGSGIRGYITYFSN